ncbi:MAG: hypothetical protein Q9159_004491 [Coniocarpon cinnabarinum]
MAVKHQDYLAAQILSEGQVINYRNVSRALKVHVNVAKQMLYDFYRIQSRRKPGSVHATYLICGSQKPNDSTTNGIHAEQNGDIEMQDSLPPSSAPGPSSSLPASSPPVQSQGAPPREVSTISMTIVREEELDTVKQQHSRIDAIHMYSLEPGTLEHLQLLSDCSRRVLEAQAKEDPLDTWKQYGTIHNPQAKRRTGARPPQPAPAPAVPVTAGMKQAAKPAAGAPTAAKDDSSRPSSSGKGSGKEEKKSSKPAVPRCESSTLFKSFAKAKPPQPKEESKGDEVMADPSDDESELAAVPETSKEAKQKAEEDKKAKAEREATLQKMMEDDDEEQDKPNEEDDAEMQDAAAEQQSDSNKSTEPRSEVVEGEIKEVTSGGGRRKGRRRVMKKKHFKDTEGYMVTREEPVWESFSEDEAPPPPARKDSGSASTLKSTAKDDKNKKGGRPGQGNIMSFFSKK